MKSTLFISTIFFRYAKGIHGNILYIAVPIKKNTYGCHSNVNIGNFPPDNYLNDDTLYD